MALSGENKAGFWLIFLSILVLALFLADLAFGSVSIPVAEVLKILTGGDAEKESWRVIVFEFRLPKALTAVIAGGALSVSGLLMQTMFRNPIAGPFVLGISSGASLGVALVVLSALPATLAAALNFDIAGQWLIVIAATAGAMLVMLLVMAVAARVKDVMTILILGLMFGSATGSVVAVLQYFSGEEMLRAFVLWTFGSLGAVSWMQLQVLAICAGIGIAISFFISKHLNMLLLGENYAVSMGLSITSTRYMIIVSTGLLAGGVTAFCGPIAFVGIAVPHIARIVLNTANHRILIPGSILAGAALMLLCDMISQLPGSIHSLPINAVTSLIGAPFVIWLVLRGTALQSHFR